MMLAFLPLVHYVAYRSRNGVLLAPWRREEAGVAYIRIRYSVTNVLNRLHNWQSVDADAIAHHS